MSAAATEPAPAEQTQPADSQFAVLHEVQDRVLWLATALVHHANRVRPNPSGVKVGGHQASSASMVSIMTALWFRHLRAEDRVSVKPHAAPVLHAVNYLLGELDASYLERLREFGGLQSYPSRVKDPGSRGLLDRVGGDRGDGTDLGRDGPAIRRHRGVWPPVLAGWRRGARRGSGLGGCPGPQRRGAGGDRLGRRPQPSVAGSRGARHRGRQAQRAVCRGGVAGHHRQVRATAAAALRASRRPRASSTDRRDEQSGVPATAAL